MFQNLFKKSQPLLNDGKPEEGSGRFSLFSIYYRRGGAFFVDNSLLIFIRAFVLYILVMTLFSQEIEWFTEHYTGQNLAFKIFYNNQFYPRVGFLLFITIAIGAVYYGFFHASKWHATLGKRLMKLQITRINDKPVGLTRAIIRYLVGLIPWLFPVFIYYGIATHSPKITIIFFLFFGLCYEMPFFQVKSKFLHDFICRTKIVERKA